MLVRSFEKNSPQGSGYVIDSTRVLMDLTHGNHACVSLNHAKALHNAGIGALNSSLTFFVLIIWLFFNVILELMCTVLFSRVALHCSVLSWVISTSMLWRLPIVSLVQSSSSPMCSSCSLSCSICSWPSLTTHTLKSSPTSPPRRVSLRSVTTSRR